MSLRVTEYHELLARLHTIPVKGARSRRRKKRLVSAALMEFHNGYYVPWAYDQHELAQLPPAHHQPAL